MRLAMSALIILLLTLPMAGLHAQNKTAPAKVAITAELVCAHCDFGIGDDCAPALKIDKTAILLTGKTPKDFLDQRFEKKVVTVEGTLELDKNKNLVLAVAKGGFLTADNKTAPAKGTARVEGVPVCGSCDLMLCDECTVAVANGKAPIILDGKLAKQHKDEDARSVTVLGKFYVDKRGLVRLDASKVDVEKKK